MKHNKFVQMSVVFVLSALSALSALCAVSADAAISPLAGLVIMLDPGHGGEDSGAVGSGGLKEATVNLRVARYLRQLLTADGATILMTREQDETVSLQKRVDMAKQRKPDLFVSIHHNASLGKTKTNRGEIYFNALDDGLPLQLANEMSRELGNSRLASGSFVIPGGYFVLRNNSVPALLTEASYISMPENEKALSTGRALTKEALVFRQAIRKVFDHPTMRVEIISKNPAPTSSPFFNLIISADRPIAKADIAFEDGQSVPLGFNKLPSIGSVYNLFNMKPLQAGEHFLRMTFHGGDGSISTQRKMTVQVHLPISEAVLLPIASYIPEGFNGIFPVRLLLKDENGNVNQQALPFQIEWDSKNVNGKTRSDGQALAEIELDGTERGSIELKATVDGHQAASTRIAIRHPNKAFILGRVSTNLTMEGLEKTRIRYGSDRLAITGPGGYFFCELPNIFRNLDIMIQPPAGYAAERRRIRTEGKMVSTPEIVLAPVAPELLGKKIAILADRSQDDWIRPMIRLFMQGGARIIRLRTPPGKESLPSSHTKDESPSELKGPAAGAIAEANRQSDLDLLLSIKRDDVSAVTFRHYYKSPKGIALGKAIASFLDHARLQPRAVVTEGSDYELGHTGATALIVALPRHTPPNITASVADALYKVLTMKPARSTSAK
ncbi:MAG: N-acetylmuramoyl-L-alanine amidase [Candidatus Riflebacteria bacterium]|nr:N-acetylmuramoyl-L-alanine amidase [Candidatus Riflebacteria bacterium]